jgi:hypothetical protein
MQRTREKRVVSKKARSLARHLIGSTGYDSSSTGYYEQVTVKQLGRATAATVKQLQV